MSSRRLLRLGIALVLIIAVVAGLNWRSGSGDAQQPLLLPDLAGALSEVSGIVVRKAEAEVVATLIRTDSGWGVSERDGFAADVSKVRKALVGLAEARIVEQKTSNPQYYERLQLRDVSDPEAQGLQIEIQGPTDPPRILIGETGVSGGDYAYVRRASEATSWLVGADLELGDETVDWLQRDVSEIETGRIHRIVVRHADGETLQVSKSSATQANFDVQDVPADRELSYAGVANAMANVLSGLRLDEVATAGSVAFEEDQTIRASFETFDGLVVDVAAFKREEEHWVSLESRFEQSLAEQFAVSEDASGESGDDQAAEDKDPDPPEPADAATIEKESAELNALTAGWTFKIPGYKYNQIAKRMDDLLKARDDSA